MPVDQQQLERLLRALDQHGGLLPFAAVAQQLDLPQLRLQGMLAAIRKVLNVDGYPVLEIDRAPRRSGCTASIWQSSARSVPGYAICSATTAPIPSGFAARVDDAYIKTLAQAVTGELGGKIGIAPRVFLRKLIGDVLDRVDLFDDFDPRRHYTLTVQDNELTLSEHAAGGKTEAAMLPLFSRMLDQDWQGLGIIYVCPIKALLNNLELRLRHYAGLFGRSVAFWHGDVGAGDKRKTRREPPDILLTTPESIEGLLISIRQPPELLFAKVKAVVVDELHALAGAGRSWRVIHINERRRVLYLEPTEVKGRSRWFGLGQASRFELCQAMKVFILNDKPPDFLSNRGAECFEELQSEFAWLDPEMSCVTGDGDRWVWWIFAGQNANAVLACYCRVEFDAVSFDAIRVRFRYAGPVTGLQESLRHALKKALDEPYPGPVAARENKFGACVPGALGLMQAAERLHDRPALRQLQDAGIKSITGSR